MSFLTSKIIQRLALLAKLVCEFDILLEALLVDGFDGLPLLLNLMKLVKRLLPPLLDVLQQRLKLLKLYLGVDVDVLDLISVILLELEAFRLHLLLFLFHSFILLPL